MYKNINTFYPNNTYLNIDFEKIKDALKRDKNYNYKDCGSILIIHTPEFMFTLNYIGKIQVYYNCISNSIINEKIKEIEKMYRKQINNFKIMYN